MQEKNLYEYAVIRVVPRVEREEFLNVGIMVFCKRAKFVKMLFAIDEAKMQLFASDLDLEQLQLNLESFQKIAHGAKNGGPIAQFELSERFRWLTALRSSAIQTSRPHSGFSSNLDETAERLFEEMVL
ncbi:DUF3037 domain-containing protein [Flavobacterium weaverense]|uniref:DUF3037 family protein n=1 Tax=Flavobacterium weaverense TaxID=271156 RepID=A0A3M0AAK1_9FLAO|nr:DUF3037 domain-containing protein [Flavobacterium weaverense]RMA76122.1 Protein of unknown function (DUF3037) [Flavobacterium weaverense]